MSTIQLSSSSSPVQNAASRELRIFVIYVIWLGFAAIATAFLTVLVWRSNSATHAVAREDAKARIEEAKSEAAQANERAQKLENDNLKLGGQVVGLQRDASDAKSVQQRVEKELAVQQERAAKAEKELIELKRSLADRDINPEQRDAMLRVLRTRPPGHIFVQSLLAGGREAMEYGTKIARVFKDAGWTVELPDGRGTFGNPVSGAFLVAGPNSNEAVTFLADVLIAGHITKAPVGVSPDKSKTAGVVEIWVAGKPPQ